MVAGLVLLLQAGAWTAGPNGATVGDTIWVERTVPAPPGWRVRADTLEASAQVEPLAGPALLRAAGGWRVRYPVVAWAPGAHTLTLPPVWRLGPDGSADSVAGEPVTVEVARVIPDSLAAPEPKPALAPIRRDRRTPVPALAAVLLGAAALAAGVCWRRRPREVGVAPHVPVEPEVPDARWLVAGEPRAVAARAAARLRAALARAVPGAHEALSTSECLAAVERLQPEAPLRELGEVLTALDRVAFASAHGTEVAELAARARALAAELAP